MPEKDELKLKKLEQKAKEKYRFNPIITVSVWIHGNIGQIDCSTIKATKEDDYYFVSAEMKNHPEKIIMLYDCNRWSISEASKWICKDCGGVWYGDIITCICTA